MADAGCTLNMPRLSLLLPGARLMTHFGLIWKCLETGATYRVFSSGKVTCLGIKRIEDILSCMAHFEEFLTSRDYPINMKDVRLLTASAAYDLGGRPDIESMKMFVGITYEPELFPAMMLKKDGIHYICHLNGKVLITGIKSPEDIDEKVMPILLEMTLCL